MNAIDKKRVVQSGLIVLPKLMTRKEARKLGKKNMPKHLKDAGFVCVVIASDPDLDGGRCYRIKYARKEEGTAA